MELQFVCMCIQNNWKKCCPRCTSSLRSAYSWLVLRQLQVCPIRTLPHLSAAVWLFTAIIWALKVSNLICSVSINQTEIILFPVLKEKLRATFTVQLHHCAVRWEVCVCVCVWGCGLKFMLHIVGFFDKTQFHWYSIKQNNLICSTIHLSNYPSMKSQTHTHKERLGPSHSRQSLVGNYLLSS